MLSDYSVINYWAGAAQRHLLSTQSPLRPYPKKHIAPQYYILCVDFLVALNFRRASTSEDARSSSLATFPKVAHSSMMTQSWKAQSLSSRGGAGEKS